EQAAAAQHAALATSELASGVQQIDATARQLRAEAERLDELVARFIVGDTVREGPLRVTAHDTRLALSAEAA
ncbi:MAG: hypothetical protein JO083_11745, partial [Candidatus Eremiobacteraeota bacterium]|nr:hypothetical protein [Candidatus Eremiobacteraeota bacterium]